jgi:hypothetical protein
MSLRSTSDTTTVTVPAGAWSGAPAGDWLVLRIDPQPVTGVSGGFQPASEVLDVTAYWALAGGAVTSFSLPLEIEVDNSQAHVVPAVFESSSWRPLAEVPASGLPAAWGDGFAYDGSNVRILTRHLSQFALLEDVEAPSKPGGFKGTVKKGKFSLSWSTAADNSGLISSYQIHANGAVAKTVDGTKRSVGMGTFKLTDRRSFQVAAVDAANNVGPKSRALKIIPKVSGLTLAAAKSALRKRGFKTGKLTWQPSATIAAGKVIKGAATGLRPAGSKIGLRVSMGAAAASRTATPTAPNPSAGSSGYPAPSSSLPPPAETVPPPVSTTTATAHEAAPAASRGRVLPFVSAADHTFSDLRRELGFGLLAAAFSIAVVAGLRARGPATTGSPGTDDQMLLWDERIVQAIRRFLRLS